MKTKIQKSVCFCPPSAGITIKHQHTWLFLLKGSICGNMGEGGRMIEGGRRKRMLVSDSVSSLARHLRTATEVEQPSLVMWSAVPCLPTQSYSAQLTKAHPQVGDSLTETKLHVLLKGFRNDSLGYLIIYLILFSSQICFVSIGNVISKCNIHFAQLTLNFRYKWPGFHTIF